MATTDEDKKTYNTITYSAPEYSDSYRDDIDTSYYTNAIAKYTQAQNESRESQIAEAGKTKENALREAYISKMQNQKSLKDSLASAGIRGGATETSNLKLANTYAQQRNAANSDYTDSVNSINKEADSNILEYDMDMTSRAEEYTQNLAQAKWNAAREDYANAIAQQNSDREYALSEAESSANIANTEANTAATEQSAQLELWSAKYDNRWATVSTKDAYKTKLKWIRKNLTGDERAYAISALRASYQANKDKK